MNDWTHPRVMVLQYEPALKMSIWKDFYHRRRSRNGLIRLLRREIKARRFVAFRLIHIEEEFFGIPPIERKAKP